MTPLPDKPKIVILVKPLSSQLIGVATNIGPGVEVEVWTTPNTFNDRSKGLPFQSVDGHVQI